MISKMIKILTVKTGFKRISQEQKNEPCFIDPAPNDGPPFDAIPGGTVRHRRLFFVFSKCKRASKVQTRHTGVMPVLHFAHGAKYFEFQNSHIRS
jgi:hypothetical protein